MFQTDESWQSKLAIRERPTWLSCSNIKAKYLEPLQAIAQRKE
jgi:hypothetical protein